MKTRKTTWYIVAKVALSLLFLTTTVLSTTAQRNHKRGDREKRDSKRYIRYNTNHRSHNKKAIKKAARYKKYAKQNHKAARKYKRGKNYAIAHTHHCVRDMYHSNHRHYYKHAPWRGHKPYVFRHRKHGKYFFHNGHFYRHHKRHGFYRAHIPYHTLFKHLPYGCHRVRVHGQIYFMLGELYFAPTRHGFELVPCPTRFCITARF